MKRQLGIWVTIAALVSMGLSACSSSSDGLPSASTVTVSEWIVQPKPAEVKNGQVKITADNVGSEDHELLVFRGSKADLPLKPNGSVDEDAAEENVVGEISDIAAGSTKSKTFDLELVGEYTIFCNIEHEAVTGMDDGSDTDYVSHYKNGMVASLTVSANN